MPYNKSERPDSPMRRRGGRRRKKVCAFCANENKAIDYKDVATLKRYVSERGKILPRRITGNCARHQRALTSRIIAKHTSNVCPVLQIKRSGTTYACIRGVPLLFICSGCRMLRQPRAYRHSLHHSPIPKKYMIDDEENVYKKCGHVSG